MDPTGLFIAAQAAHAVYRMLPSFSAPPPAPPAAQAADALATLLMGRSSTSSTVAGSITVGVALVGARILYGLFGDQIARGMSQTVDAHLSHLGAAGATAGGAGHRPAASGGGGGGGGGGMIELFAARGAQTTPEAARGQLSERATGVLLLVLGTALQYLHWVGASDMRARTRAGTPPEGAGGVVGTAVGPATPPTAAEEGGAALRAWADWRAGEALKVRKDLVGDGPSRLTHDGLLDAALRRRYADHPFYARAVDGAPPAPYFTLRQNDPVRIVINVLLGFALQVNALLGAAPAGRPEAAIDPIHVTTRVVSFIAYWEVFARALRLYGWAPVYVATQCVAELLLSASAKPTTTSTTQKKAHAAAAYNYTSPQATRPAATRRR